MTDYPVNLSLPGAGMIAVVGKLYETLTDEFLQQWLLELYRDHLVIPDYLLVSQEGQRELHRMVQADYRLWIWVSQNAQDASGERAERYPNKITGHPLTIVVFPGLPEKTLMLASLLKMKEETVLQVDALSRVVTRSYAPVKEHLA